MFFLTGDLESAGRCPQKKTQELKGKENHLKEQIEFYLYHYFHSYRSESTGLAVAALID
jgi:predicted  nucleic acid-binding Zn-ribbon protein